MDKMYLFPILISATIVVVVYMMKKDEPDQNKRPNYPVLFIMCLIVSASFIYMFGSKDESINLVLKEIHTGEPTF
jgi:hypothetical protein